MIKLTCVVVLFTALTCGNGEIGIFIRVGDNRENPVNLPWVVAKTGDNFVLSCRLIGNENNNVDQVYWKSNSNNVRFINSNKPFELNFKPITLDAQRIYVCGNKDESKAINVLVYDNAKEKILHDKEKRDVEYFDNAVPQSSTDDDDKKILELLDSLNKPETTEISDVNSYNNLPNINWHNIHEINDNWPTNLQWSPPETNKYPLSDPFNFTIEDINYPSFKFDTDVRNNDYEYKTSFTHFYYGIPLAILLILTGILRVCCANAKRNDPRWVRLTSGTTCQHRICNRRRNTNPSAGCMLEGRDAGRFSVLIIRRFTTIGSGSNNSNSNNNNDEANEAPPSYDDSTRNLVDNASTVGQSDLPPPYSEVLANVSTGDCSNLRDTVASPAVVSELPKPHAAGTQQV